VSVCVYTNRSDSAALKKSNKQKSRSCAEEDDQSRKQIKGKRYKFKTNKYKILCLNYPALPALPWLRVVVE
jgi:hypothetical protein